jgi:peptidoglycan/LPS O-acetylase OafA/YrhL
VTPVQQPARRGLGYRPTLDGFRALAVVLVLLHHSGVYLVPGLRHFFDAGFLGVDLFFALSGFLITTLLLERRGHERHPIGTFYARRALRLLPAVVVLLVVVSLFAVATDAFDKSTIPMSDLAGLTYWINWAAIGHIHLLHYFGQLWSLSVEEQFYVVWPLLLYGGLRVLGTQRRVAALALAGAVLVVLWRARLWHEGLSWLEVYQRTDARADGLLLGAALALVPWRPVVERVRDTTATAVGLAALVAIVVLSIVTDRSSSFLYYGGFTVVAVLALTLICALLRDGRLAAVFATAPLVRVGRWSYSLYLWHFPVFFAVAERTQDWPGAPRLLLGWALAFAFAIGSYELVERPALRFKDRLGTPNPADARPAP